MSQTQYSVLSTWYTVIGLALLITTTGCLPPLGPSGEGSLGEQLAAIKAGYSDEIEITVTSISDDDLAQLASAPGLRVLLIDHPDSQITAAGIKHLGGLASLKHLRLRGPGIDDVALTEIANLKSLQILNVPRGTFTDAGLAQLKTLPNLEMLRFGSPRVGDAGMKTLCELPALTRLHLIDVPITDAGLEQLATMEQLESLYIDGGNISDAAWDEFFRLRPKLHVHVNQQHHDRDPHAHVP